MLFIHSYLKDLIELKTEYVNLSLLDLITKHDKFICQNLLKDSKVLLLYINNYIIGLFHPSVKIFLFFEI